MTFEDLESWQHARMPVREVYGLTRGPVISKDFGLTGRIQRASVSVMTNIAERFERSHLAEKPQSYNVARASIGEVRSLAYVIEDNSPVHTEQALALRDQANRTGRLVSGLITSTRARRSTDA